MIEMGGMKYRIDRIQESPHLSELEKYVRIRLLTDYGWDPGDHKDMYRPPSSLEYAYDYSKVPSKLIAEYNKVSYPSDKYVKVSKRRELIEENKMELLKVVTDAIEQDNCRISSAEAVKSSLSSYLKTLFANPKYDGVMLSTKKAKMAIDARYMKALGAAEALSIECLCGTCENPVVAFNKLVEVDW